MRKLSKLQYEVIFLSKGLTFKEIDAALATASKGAEQQPPMLGPSRCLSPMDKN